MKQPIRKPLIIGVPYPESFRFDENGNLHQYTKYGRKRKHWKVRIRELSKRYLKDKCELCPTTEYLTIHHLVPLNVAVIMLGENCQTLCKTCHIEVDNDQQFNYTCRKKK